MYLLIIVIWYLVTVGVSTCLWYEKSLPELFIGASPMKEEKKRLKKELKNLYTRRVFPSAKDEYLKIIEELKEMERMQEVTYINSRKGGYETR